MAHYVPEREAPLPGLEDMEITGPLAFRDREFREGGGGGGRSNGGGGSGRHRRANLTNNSGVGYGDRRAFRDRTRLPLEWAGSVEEEDRIVEHTLEVPGKDTLW